MKSKTAGSHLTVVRIILFALSAGLCATSALA